MNINTSQSSDFCKNEQFDYTIYEDVNGNIFEDSGEKQAY